MGWNLGLGAVLLVSLLATLLVIAWILLPLLLLSVRAQVKELVRQQVATNQHLKAIARDSEASAKVLQAARPRTAGP